MTSRHRTEAPRAAVGLRGAVRRSRVRTELPRRDYCLLGQQDSIYLDLRIEVVDFPGV